MNKTGKEFSFWFNIIFTLIMYYIVLNKTSLKLSEYYIGMLVFPIVIIILILLKIQIKKRKVLHSEHKLDKEVDKLKKKDEKIIKI